MKTENKVLNCLRFFVASTSQMESKFGRLHSDFNSLEFGLLQLTGKTNSPKGIAKEKDAIISETIL
jgi:hypothetical protein